MVDAGTLVAEIKSPEVTALQAEYHEAEVESERETATFLGGRRGVRGCL